MSLDLQPPNLTQVSLQLSSTNFKLHPPINELTIITALSWLLLIQTRKWRPYKVRGLFLSFGCTTHLPLSHVPFLLMQKQLYLQRILLDGYIQENIGLAFFLDY